MSKLITVLDSPVIVEILLQMGKISKLSFHSIKHTAVIFSGSLKARSTTAQARISKPKCPTPPPFNIPGIRKVLPIRAVASIKKDKEQPAFEPKTCESIRILL